MEELSKAYEPADVEPRWYKYWLDLGVFKAGTERSLGKPPYVVPMPPPNVTGSLHMGHALGCTFQDVLVRHKRMLGFDALWQPGIDHAGISTQVVVERLLKRGGDYKTEHQISHVKWYPGPQSP